MCPWWLYAISWWCDGDSSTFDKSVIALASLNNSFLLFRTFNMSVTCIVLQCSSHRMCDSPTVPFFWSVRQHVWGVIVTSDYSAANLHRCLSTFQTKLDHSYINRFSFMSRMVGFRGQTHLVLWLQGVFKHRSASAELWRSKSTKPNVELCHDSVHVINHGSTLYCVMKYPHLMLYSAYR